MSAKDFLVEIGTEELPPKALKKLSNAFTNGILTNLDTAKLTYNNHKSFSTPRRLALLINGLQTSQSDQNFERKGPSLKAAFDDKGNPTKAIKGFAKSCGVNVDNLETLKTPNGSWVVYKSTKQGIQTISLLPNIISKSLASLPISKRMRWGERHEEFVRPTHWLLILFGNDIVECEILGLKASNKSRGHRFHANHTITISTPSEYQERLKEDGWVIADFNARRKVIENQIKQEANNLKGTAVISEDLLSEVTGLVEWPVTLSGKFDESFLDMPPESIITPMKEHQKYFHILNDNGSLKPYFITVSNIKSNKQIEVILGNERVIKPRLSDAKFFFENDKKTTQIERREKLNSIVFQSKLGSLFDKTERISRLAAWIAKQEGGNIELAKKAGQLSKSDLVSEMVQEFPELQGVMGQYYSSHDGEEEVVSKAINQQYSPRFAGDDLPDSIIGCALAIADKIDTITGIFGVGLHPTGSKDPFGLRRASIGVLRIIIEKKLNLDLCGLVDQAQKNYKATMGVDLPEHSCLKKDSIDYIMERFNAYYQDNGTPIEIINAVKTLNPTKPLDFDRRIKAICHFYKMSEASALASANKRVSNILTKSDNLYIPNIVDDKLLNQIEEINLSKELHSKRKEIAPFINDGNYCALMECLATLKGPIDIFFDKVLVNTEDEAVKLNRYALLNQLRDLFLHVADISLLHKS